MTGEARDHAWPRPKFNFSVTFGDHESASFQEVDGLETPADPIEYRHGNSPIFAPIKMPGLSSTGSVTMKKGVFANGEKFRQWYDEIKMNTIQRCTVAVSLLDETGAPKMTWTLDNAWPIKITGADFQLEGNEVAVESVEIAYQTLTVAAPQT